MKQHVSRNPAASNAETIKNSLNRNRSTRREMPSQSAFILVSVAALHCLSPSALLVSPEEMTFPSFGYGSTSVMVTSLPVFPAFVVPVGSPWIGCNFVGRTRQPTKNFIHRGTGRSGFVWWSARTMMVRNRARAVCDMLMMTYNAATYL